MNLLINTDGGVTHNSATEPSLAYASFVAYAEDGTYHGSLSNELTGTNNEAEYAAIALALATVVAKQDEGVYGLAPGDTITIRCDSRLVVEQIAGTYKVKNTRMKLWLKLVQTQIAVLEKMGLAIQFVQVPRSENKEADRLCNVSKTMGPKTDYTAPIPGWL